MARLKAHLTRQKHKRGGKKKHQKKHKDWKNDPKLKTALLLVSKGMSVRKAGSRVGMAKSTVSENWQNLKKSGLEINGLGINEFCNTKSSRPFLLTDAEECAIEKYILHLAARKRIQL